MHLYILYCNSSFKCLLRKDKVRILWPCQDICFYYLHWELIKPKFAQIKTQGKLVIHLILISLYLCYLLVRANMKELYFSPILWELPIWSLIFWACAVVGRTVDEVYCTFPFLFSFFFYIVTAHIQRVQSDNSLYIWSLGLESYFVPFHVSLSSISKRDILWSCFL